MVWVITRRTSALWRIDAKTNQVVTEIPLSVIPWRVALGSGAVWITAYRSSNHNGSTRGGTVIRIDPKTNRIAARIPLGDLGPDGILVSHALVWVSVPPSPWAPTGPVSAIRTSGRRKTFKPDPTSGRFDFCGSTSLLRFGGNATRTARMDATHQTDVGCGSAHRTS